MIVIVATIFSLIISLIASVIAVWLIYQFICANQSIDFKATSTSEVIVITGCDSGIGLQLAKYFHKTTEYTIICGFFDVERSKGWKDLLEMSDADVTERLIMVKLDIRSGQDSESLVKLLEELKSEKSPKHLVAMINNAGIMTYGEFDWLTWHHIESQVNTNLLGTIRITRAVLPYIIESKGRIVNISSVNDMTVFPGLSIYSATKSALSTFSRGLGYELRKFGAHVVTMRLGDFARLTNIMSGHESYRDEMWDAMSSKKQEIYKDFFHKFNEHLLKNYGMTSPADFEQSSLFQDFRRAVLAPVPPTTITCAPFGFKIFYFIIELTPVWIQYHLLDGLMQLSFNWVPPRTKIPASR